MMMMIERQHFDQFIRVVQPAEVEKFHALSPR